MHELPRQMKTPAKFRTVLSNNDVLFDFSEIANFFFDVDNDDDDDYDDDDDVEDDDDDDDDDD